MAQIGIMLEGQSGLTWERWARLLQAAEDWGFQCVFRSDHFTDPNPPDQESLELWVSLTYAASHTKRIEFGPCVMPVTFRPPAMSARMAAQVDDLSGGRLVLGMGAGWQEREHKKFGVPFYDMPTRFAMFEEALQLTTRLLGGAEPVSYQGQYFTLDEAQLLPKPKRRTPVLIGGNGEKRTLPLVAKYADEWNGVYITPETYRAKNAVLNRLLVDGRRDPADVKRSLMTGLVYGKDEAALKAKIAARGGDEATIKSRGVVVGPAAAAVDQISAFVEAGCERFMLQWLDLDDLDGLEAFAKDVLPQVGS